MKYAHSISDIMHPTTDAVTVTDGYAIQYAAIKTRALQVSPYTVLSHINNSDTVPHNH